jgi:hypothetical protein
MYRFKGRRTPFLVPALVLGAAAFAHATWDLANLKEIANEDSSDWILSGDVLGCQGKAGLVRATPTGWGEIQEMQPTGFGWFPHQGKAVYDLGYLFRIAPQETVGLILDPAPGLSKLFADFHLEAAAGDRALPFVIEYRQGPDQGLHRLLPTPEDPVKPVPPFECKGNRLTLKAPASGGGSGAREAKAPEGVATIKPGAEETKR